MKSLFARNFLIYAMVIVLGFAILGSAFIYQVNRFALEEKQQQLSDAAERAVQSTAAYFETRDSADWMDKFNTNYKIAMHLLAADCSGTIFVGDAQGKLLFIANSDGCYSQMNNDLTLPDVAMTDVIEDGVYAQSSNFFGFLATQNYVLGQTVVSGGTVKGAVFVCVPARSTQILFLNLSRVFILMTLAVLLLTP